MSLVEQALKKAKESGRPLPLSTASPVDTPSPDSMDASVAVATRQGGVIEPSPEITATIKSLRSVSIDHEALRREGYQPPIEQEREISEQFRHIKRPLVARAFGRGMQRSAGAAVIVISSALPGEGKTFSALNLAFSLALETDSSVVLVDADTVKPQISKTLRLMDEPGLVDALIDESVDVESLLILTDVPKLSILPVGRAAESASELLASARMADVLQRLTSSQWPNRIVLIDAPPLLVTNEAKTLVDSAGQVVLVVRANSTPQRAVLDAISHLREEQFVGLILNQSDTVAGIGYGYYGHMYQYGQADKSGSGR